MIKQSKYLIRLSQGALMGVANTIPGVSGGTLALMFGIYEELIEALRDGAKAVSFFVRGKISDGTRGLKSVNWKLLVPLGIGAVAAVVILAGPLESGLENHPEEMAGLFLGLVVGSIVISWRLLPLQNLSAVATITGVGLIVFFCLGWQSGPISDPSPLILFFAGAITICAMILPGLSGSFLLLMFGLYESVLEVIDDRIWGDAAIFAVGAVIGLALFATLLDRLLNRYRTAVLAVLIGLMVGSLRVLWPWPNGVGSETEPGVGLDWPTSGEFLTPTLLAIGAFVVVLAFDALAKRTTHS
ncbi:MAG: DUF368 domain-containing protein [Gammaproteobacteria bacterium]|nr:DUF368 domain-containing protein [Gammaproteobacteria bacterium]